MAARNDALRARGGGSYADKVMFGELLAAALAGKRGQDARQVLARLESQACETRLGAEAGGFVNVSFLVHASVLRAFEIAFTGLQREMSAVAEVRVFGPLPPYSFVSPAVTSQSWVC